MHPSSRMALALYQNGMLRLWSMLDARCIFKKKVGVARDNSDGEYDEEDLSEIEKDKTDMSKAYV